MADGDCRKNIGKEDQGEHRPDGDEPTFQVYPRSWRIATTLHDCLSRIVGKYTAYPNVDSSTFRRMHKALNGGISQQETSMDLGNYCQELRAVTACDPRELLKPRDADDTDARIMAIAQVVRGHAALDDKTFRELLTGLLSWSPADKAVIQDTLVRIIRS